MRSSPYLSSIRRMPTTRNDSTNQERSNSRINSSVNFPQIAGDDEKNKKSH